MSKSSTPLARMLGTRIANLRAEIHLTQEKLSYEIGMGSKGYMSRIEAGERLPSLDVLERIARRLGVEVRDLFIAPDRGSVDQAMEMVRLGGGRAAERLLAKASKGMGK